MQSRFSRFDQFMGRVAGACVRLACKRPAFVATLCGILTVASLAYAAVFLGVNSDTNAMLSEDLPFRRLTKQLEKAFPQLDEPLIVVVDADTPERAREAASDLAASLSQRSDLFRSVFAPGVGTFFDKHGLLYLDEASLEHFSDRLVDALPFISPLAKEPTLSTLADLVERALDPTVGGGLDREQLPDLYDGLANVLEAPVGRDDVDFSWTGWVFGGSNDKRMTRHVLVVQPVLHFDDLKAARRPIAAIRASAERLGLVPGSGVEVRVTGKPALGAEEMDVVARQAGIKAVVASILSVTLLLLIALRSLRLVLVIIVTLLAGLSWTTGFAALAVGRLNLVSIAFAVLFVGLAVDFGIHFALHFCELVAKGDDPRRALLDGGTEVGGSITLCAVTTALGFYAFVPTRYAGVAELGLISGTGMFLSLAATLLLFPALLTLTGGGTKNARLTVRAQLHAPVSALPVRHPTAVCVATLVAVVVSSFALPYVRFDPDPVKVRDPTTESVETMTDLLSDGSQSPWTVEVMVANAAEAEKVAARLDELPEVSRAVTLQDFVPKDQDAKLETLDDLAFFVDPLEVAPADSVGTEKDGDTVAKLTALRDAVDERLAKMREEAVDTATASETAPQEEAPDENAKLQESLLRLRGAAEGLLAHIRTSPDPQAETHRIEKALLGRLPVWIDQLKESVTANRVVASDLPPSIRDRFIASDGRARVEVYPSADLSDPAALEDFVDGVRRVVPASAGSAVEIVESGRAIVVALRQALVGAVLAVTVLLLVLWGSVKDTLIVLSALLLGATFTAATMVAIGLNLNFADVIVLPLLLGIGVDSGIHFMHRYRMGESAGLVLGSSTARAVLFSALTTIASFGSLAFSSHKGIASLGILLSVGLSYMLTANLVFLPALLVLFERRRGRHIAPNVRRRRLA